RMLKTSIPRAVARSESAPLCPARQKGAAVLRVGTPVATRPGQRPQQPEEQRLHGGRRSPQDHNVAELRGEHGQLHGVGEALGVGVTVPSKAEQRLDHLQKAGAVRDQDTRGGLLLTGVPPVVPVPAQYLNHLPGAGEGFGAVEPKADPSGFDREALVEVSVDVLSDHGALRLQEEVGFERPIAPLQRRLDKNAALARAGILQRIARRKRLRRLLENRGANYSGPSTGV